MRCSHCGTCRHATPVHAVSSLAHAPCRDVLFCSMCLCQEDARYTPELAYREREAALKPGPGAYELSLSWVAPTAIKDFGS
jgi:hypothetical protein